MGKFQMVSPVKQHPNATPEADDKRIHITPPLNCILSYNLMNLYISFLISIKKTQNQNKQPPEDETEKPEPTSVVRSRVASALRPQHP